MKTKAAVVYEYRKPMVIEELELDGPKQKEVLIKYGAAGLCHSDLSVINGVLTVSGKRRLTVITVQVI